jgi:NAD(P)-dependent dehydrogenase (short-subunit alcohol dehydrogenase family)
MPSDRKNLQRLDGKSAVITGATGGIGEATAKLFLDLGAKVMLVGRNGNKLAETCERLGAGANCSSAIADSTDEAAIAAAVKATLQQFGSLDILVANAGTEGVLKPIEALSVEDFEEVLRVNVIGVWLAMKYAAPARRQPGEDRSSPYLRSRASSAFLRWPPTSRASTPSRGS